MGALQSSNLTIDDRACENAAPPSPAAEANISRRSFRKLLMIGGALVVIGAAAMFGAYYWTIGRFLVSTDDAGFQADTTIIAPKVSGYIAEVNVSDNEPVTPGQVLARIDDRDLGAALDRAKANVAERTSAIADIDAQLASQESLIDQAAADVVLAQASLDLARINDGRYRKMAVVGYASEQQADLAGTELRQRTAALRHQYAALVNARRQVDILTARRALAEASLKGAQADERQAALNLGYTAITAPIGGVVGARTLRVGQYVQAGTQLMAVVPLAGVYVVANFRETQLEDVRPGQEVEIDVDSFPDKKMTGYVDSIAPAAGQQFALLPPDNATGNFTKIVQRIPVKILLGQPNALAGRIRPGMSVVATIHTQAPVSAAPAHPGANSATTVP